MSLNLSDRILLNVESTIEKYHMISSGDTIVLGVSGGADSVMLLDVLNVLKDKYNFKIVVAHVNHKIRKGDAERDADFVKNLCAFYGLEFRLKEAYIKDLALEWNMGEEEAGRKVRYSFFQDLAEEFSPAKIATAHNANDNVETVLMRMIRGTGLKGLSGISYKRDNIIRPILDISRDDIEAYIRMKGLIHITDSTNFENIYTRNKIRLDLIPFIKNDFNPNVIDTINSNIKSYTEDSDYFEREVLKVFNDNVIYDSGVYSISNEYLKDLHPAVAKRLLIKIIKSLMNREQIDLGVNEINKLYQNLYDVNKVGTIFTINTNYRVRIGYDNMIIFEKVMDIKPNDLELKVKFDSHMGSFDFRDLKLVYELVEENQIVNTPNCFYLPFRDYSSKELVIRTRRDGDIFRVNDRLHKKLGKYMTDKKIDSVLKNKILLLCDDNEVLCGFDYFVTRFDKRNGEFIKVDVLY